MVDTPAVVLPVLLIRADAGGFIGTGHVMRMMALAQSYIRRGGKVAIASLQCPEQLVGRLKDSGIDHHYIDAAKLGSDEDAVDTLRLSKELGAEWVVLDGYHFNYEYQKRLKQSELSILCTDDHGYSDKWCCDAILNQNLDSEKHIKYENDIAGFKRLLGGSFCLFREEFLQGNQAKKPWKKIERLLITLGGSDPENATAATLRLLNTSISRSLTIRVLAGADNPHVEGLRAFESQHQIEVVQNATNMPEQYAWADGIISAGGSTCWEWLYLGLPGAIVTIADNQLPIVKALSEDRQAALPLGWFNSSTFEASKEQLSKWLDVPEEVCDAQVARQLIDGGGASRVAGVLADTKVLIREATLNDSDLYLVWANDSVVRMNSFSPDLIDANSHANWFRKRLNDPKSRLLVGYSLDGKNVGQVRFDYNEEQVGWVIDFSIDSNCRGGGYGKAIMKEGLHWLRARYDGELLILADVLKTNPSSMRIFEALGFKKVGNRDNFYSYSLSL